MNIKYSFFYLLYIVGSIGIVSCAEENLQENPGSGETSREVRLDVMQEQSFTKAAGTDFEIGDAIGVYAVMRKESEHPATPSSNKNYSHNVKWVKTENGWRPASPADVIIYPEDGSKLDFYAYYPYYPYKGSDADPREFWFDIPEDQSTHEGYTCSDFMTAGNLEGKTQGAVELVFSHQLALLEVELTAGTGINLQHLEQVEIKGRMANFYINICSNEFDTYWSDVYNLKMNRVATNDGTYIFRGIIPPQEIGDNELLFVCYVNGQKHGFKAYTADFQSGKTYRYTITIE